MTDTRIETTKLAPDLRIIVGLVEPKSTVLDLGCGSGDLLKELQVRKNVFPQGVEKSEECIQHCVSKGLPVYHGDLNEGLKDFADQALDYVILTNVIQVLHRPDDLLRDAAKVGRKVIVSFPNFAFYGCRWQLGVLGQMPKTRALPNEWYDSLNIHLTTIKDFERLCQSEGYRVLDRLYLRSRGETCARIRFLPNLLADQAIFIITLGAAG